MILKSADHEAQRNGIITTNEYISR